MDTEPLYVLLVEDDPDHAELVKLAFEEQQVARAVHHVSDGRAALDYLFRRGEYADPGRSPRPQLILLDLRLPRMDGLEVLKAIRTAEDLELRRTPIVVLTSSEVEKDAAAAYDCHANSYVVKPAGPEKFQQLVADLGFYWLVWNRLAA